jgi:arginase
MDNLSFLENQPAKKEISILPIPLSLGSDDADTANAPKYLLNLGLQKALESSGLKIKVLGDISIAKDVADIFSNIDKVVREEVLKNNKVLAIGGDHAISIGTIVGAAEALAGNLGVIWIDAHGDLNAHDTSASSHLHGMVGAALLGLDKTSLSLIKVRIKTENILYIGLKDLDQAEIDLIRAQKITAVTMLDILEGGFSTITQNIKLLNKKVDHIWISLDMDAIDREAAPGVAMATSGGLTYREITNLINYIGKTSEVVGMDLVEVTPEKDFENKTGKLCIELAASAFGAQHNWYTEYMSHYKK